MSKELRKTPRRTLQREMGVLYHGEYEVEFCLQIGEGGLMFRSQRFFEVGTEAVVTLFLPGSGGFSSKIELLYMQKEGPGTARYGCRFLALSLDVKRLIRQYVAAKTEKEAEEDLLAS